MCLYTLKRNYEMLLLFKRKKLKYKFIINFYNTQLHWNIKKVVIFHEA